MLDFGKLIASGPTAAVLRDAAVVRDAAVLRDAAVVRAYLGVDQ